MTLGAVPASRHDLFLFWLSHRGDVSPATATRACKALAARFCSVAGRQDDVARCRGEILDPLQALGHLEYDLKKSRYCIVPAILVWATRPDGSELGVFYGARTPRMASLLTKIFRDAFRREPQLQEDSGPARWSVTEDRAAVEQKLANLPRRVVVVDERGADLLAALLPVSQALAVLPTYRGPREGGWQRATFHRRSLWEDLPGEPFAAGLYRRMVGNSPWVYKDENGREAQLHSLEQHRLGQWRAALAHDRIGLVYDPSQMVLSVPSGHRLPILVDRALRLVSGYCPRRTPTGAREYIDIDDHRARQAARILEVELEER